MHNVCPRCGQVWGDATGHVCIQSVPGGTHIKVPEGHPGIDVPSIMRSVGFDQGWNAAIEKLWEWCEQELKELQEWADKVQSEENDDQRLAYINGKKFEVLEVIKKLNTISE